MTVHRNHIRHRVDPRDVPALKAARRLGLTLAAFEAAKADLFARGFPRPDQTTGMYDLKALDVWMDERSHLTNDLTSPSSPRNAQEVFGERARRFLDGQ
jgi:hypothetical protein